MAKTQLSVQNLRKTFDEGATVAVNDISFEISKGEIGALLGPSGCGKTTTLRCIAGVEHPKQGTIQIGDQVVASDEVHVAAEDRGIGMVFQNYAIWPHKSVFENVMFSLKHAPNPFEPSEYEDRVMEILEIVRISELSDKPATDLSGGQQQRTALARAVVHDPEMLLLDEPLSNLDAKLRTTMRNEIQRLQYELGITMLYVTHDQEEAFYLADDVIIMKDGDIMETGNPITLYNHPENGFTRDFVGRWNQFKGTVENGYIRTPLGDFDTETLETNSTGTGHCSVFVRPTDVNMKNGKQETGKLTGIVIAEGVIGEMYEITLNIGGEETVTVQTPDYKRLDRGEELTLEINPEDLQVYPET